MAILNLRWRLETAKIAGCPAIVGDRLPGAPGTIVAGTTTGDVVMFGGEGTERWRTHIGATVSCWPTIDDVPGVGPSILAADEAGRVACLAPTGEIRWAVDIAATFTPFNNVSVVRGGGEVALVATDRRGRVTGLTSAGRVAWQFATGVFRNGFSPNEHAGVGPAAVGDLDGDGADEIVFVSGDGGIWCLGTDGVFRWTVPVSVESEYSGTAIADFGAGPRVLAGATDDLLRCIAPDGTIVWTARGAGAGYIELGIGLGDMDGDGTDDVVLVHQGRALQIIDHATGELRSAWFQYGGGDQAYGPSIADVDGDGLPEMLIAQRRARTLRVVRADGTLADSVDFPASMAGAPVVGDVDGDGKLEVLGVGMSNGELVCYGTPGPATPTSAPWPTSRGAFDGRANRSRPTDRRSQGYARTVAGSVALTRRSPVTLAVGANDLSYAAGTAFPAIAVIEIAVAGPDGIVRRSVQRHEDEPVAFEIIDLGAYKVAATLVEQGTGRILGTLAETFVVEPLADERADAERLLAELDGVATESAMLRSLARARRLAWSDLDARIAEYVLLPVADRRTLIADVRDTLTVIRREIAVQRLRAEIKTRTGKPVEFIPWLPASPWAEFNPAADAPVAPVESLSILTDGRAYEAAVVEVANVLPWPIDVRVSLDPLKGEDGATAPSHEHFTLRQVTWVPTTTDTRETAPSGKMGADALPDLGQAGIFRIPASSAARLWIDVATGALPPGTYGSTIRFRALTPAGATWDIAVAWRVAATALPEVMPLHFCNWGYPNGSRYFGDLAEASLEDMQDHHTTVFVTVGNWCPSARYDAAGNLLGIDWRDHGWFLSKMRPQNILLFPGNPLVAAEGAPGMWSEPWKKAFAAFLPEWAKFLRERGFGYDRWAFYPVDEPGLVAGSDIEELERYARFVKGIDSFARIYTDPYRGYTIADYERTVDVLDILQPAYHILVGPNLDRARHLKMLSETTDRRFWIYEAQAGVKDMIHPTYYWGEIWTAWEYGFTGIGYWTYCTGGDDPWSAQQDYILAYTGATKPVPSVRWQAVRIGIEDYARMARLRDAIVAARRGDRCDAADRAEKRLAAIPAEARAAEWDPALMASIRRELIEIAVELGA